jgi:LysR family hydrogen peroxide-inducible transcriptional activator
MNLRDLEYLVAVADHRHFGEAATATFASQPTLSTQIRKLEAELGVQLIERTPRNVALTTAGARVVTEARAVLERVAAIRAVARAARDPEAATVRLGLFPTVAPYLLPHVVPLIRSRYPHLELLLVEEKTEVLVDRLRDGRLDAAVLARPVREDQFDETILFVEDFVLAVPVDHALAGSTEPVPLSVLAGLQVLLLEEGHCLRDQALAVCQLAGADEWSGFRATSLETMRQMVAAGVGVTLLPQLAVEPPVAPNPDVRILPFAEPVPRREIAMYWRRTSPYRELLEPLSELVGAAPRELLRSSTLPGATPTGAARS